MAVVMAARDTVHALVDALPEGDLPAVERFLELLRKAGATEDFEDAIDSYTIRALRTEQTGDEVEPLEQFGRRLGLT